MKLPAYPRYKPSGVEWLGDVPEHWEVKRLSYLATLKSGENITSEMIAEGGDYPVYGGNGIRGNYHKFTHRGHHALIGRQGALCGNINYASGDFWASEHALVVSPLKEFAVAWMGELLRAMNLGQYSVTAAQPGIAAEVIRGLRIPIPPLTEQRVIAAFLDRETGRVDRLVVKKRELIERLKEKRTALISRTVTRGLPTEAAAKAGLPANPPLKPSGLDWLGDIPEHWDMRRIATVADKITNGFVGPTRNILVDEGVRYLQSLHIKENKILFHREYYIEPEWSAAHQKSLLREDDVLIVQTGDIGQVAVVTKEFEGCNCHALIIVGPNPGKLHGPFLSWFLNSSLGFDELKRIQTGALHPHLNCGLVRDVRFACPPLAEQSAIASYLDAETAKLDALVAKVEQAVERLEEYRTALITAAVTGKIDVRTTTSPEK